MEYTDGIGTISKNLIDEVRELIGDKKASVLQIRYKGNKGVVALDTTLPKDTIIFRKSMCKFQCPNKDMEKYLDILNSNVHKTGYLNRQIIVLLEAVCKSKYQLKEGLMQIQN